VEPGVPKQISKKMFVLNPIGKRYRTLIIIFKQ
jgi:hypothetical protein